MVSSSRNKHNKRSLTLVYYISLIAGFSWFEYCIFGALQQGDFHNIIVNSTATTGKLERPKLSRTWLKDNFIQKSNEKTQNELPKTTPKLKVITSEDIKKPPPPYRDIAEFHNCSLLRPDDLVYTYGPWDGSPIVLETHKLLFFSIPKVGTTVWKQLFRRIEGYTDWMTDHHPLPHAPPRNGLKYLYDYPPMVADQMMTDPSWTRAMFVRDPKERLLSAYLDKGTQNQYVQYHCCKKKKPRDTADPRARLLYTKLQCDNPKPHMGPTGSQADKATNPQLLSFLDFLSLLVPACQDPHWNPQTERIDAKYWPFINFVGHMETIEADSRRLLKQIGAWDEYGSHGWPPRGEIFAGSGTITHATDSKSKLSTYFTTPHVEQLVDKMVEKDYQNPVLSLQNRRIVDTSNAQ